MFTKEEIESAITKIRTLRNVLTVEAYLPIKKYSRDKKIFLLTHDIERYICDNYEVLQVLKTDKISNWEKNGYGRNGIWKFKVKKKPSTKKKAPPAPKSTKSLKEKLPEKQEKPPVQEKHTPSEKKETKKTSKSSSFRGRIKKIASKK